MLSFVLKFVDEVLRNAGFVKVKARPGINDVEFPRKFCPCFVVWVEVMHRHRQGVAALGAQAVFQWMKGVVACGAQLREEEVKKAHIETIWRVWREDRQSLPLPVFF